MAFQNLTPFMGEFKSAADYSSATNLYRVVRLTTSGTVKRSTAVTLMPLGILQNTPGSSEAAMVQVGGISQARCLSTAHSAIVPGTKLAASTAGNGSIAPSTAVARATFARALEALAANTTGVIAVLITHEGAGSSGAGTVG